MTTATRKEQARARREADEEFRKVFEGYLFECFRQPGFKLESESELAKRFGVTRYRIRKAIERLNQAGILQRVKHGGSTVIQVLPEELSKKIDLQFQVAGFTDEQYREAVEGLLGGLAPVLLEKLRSADIAALEVKVGEMAEEMSPEYARFAVLAFMKTLVEKTGNPILVIYFEVLKTRFERGEPMEAGDCPKLVGLCRDLVKDLKKDRRKRVVASFKALIDML